MKILVAEDEKPLANVLKVKLTSSGFEVDVAEDGEQAVKHLSQGKYDLVLLDIVMPKKNGFEVLDYIGKNKITAKVIVTSNLSQPEDQEKAKSMGAIDYLVKSDSSIAQIIEKVNSVVNK